MSEQTPQPMVTEVPAELKAPEQAPFNEPSRDVVKLGQKEVAELNPQRVVGIDATGRAAIMAARQVVGEGRS